MTYLKAAILGLVQGIAEFLPISSSGHLAILQQWFGIDADNVVAFSILLHTGTLIAVFICYWNDIWELIKELGRTIADLVTLKGLHLEEKPLRKFGMMIIVATIPTALIGYVIDKFINNMYNSLIFIACGLIVTGILLILTNRFKDSYRTVEKMNFRNAIFIGVMQGFAVCPGLSRSGSTLFSSLLLKLDRDFAVKFVFILSIPPTFGSIILEFPELIQTGLDVSLLGPILVGMLVATLSGIFAIKFVSRVVSKNNLSKFAIYVWIVALIIILVKVFKVF